MVFPMWLEDVLQGKVFAARWLRQSASPRRASVVQARENASSTVMDYLPYLLVWSARSASIANTPTVAEAAGVRVVALEALVVYCHP